MKHIFDTNIAKTCGIEEAIILENIYFWCIKNEANNKLVNGRPWTYNSVKAFTTIFDYMSPSKISRALKTLETEGYIVIGEFNNNAYDHTKWYCITEKTREIYGDKNEKSNCQNEKSNTENDNSKSTKCQINITDINTNSNINNKPNIEKEKSQKPSLLQREPKNDLEVIEKEYLLNYQYLYKKGFVKSEKPVNDWLQSRRNTNNAINQYGLDLVLKAVKNSKLDQFCINCGYKLTTIISTGVLSRLINGKVERINIANDEINISEEDIPF